MRSLPICLAASALLAGCINLGPVSEPRSPVLSSSPLVLGTSEALKDSPPRAASRGVQLAAVGRNSPSSVAPSGPASPLRFDDAPLDQVVRLIYEQALGMEVVSTGSFPRVSVELDRSLRPSQLVDVARMLMDQNGVTGEERNGILSLYGSDRSSGAAARLVFLQHRRPSDLQPLIAAFSGASGAPGEGGAPSVSGVKIVPDDSLRAAFVVGAPDQVDRLVRLIRELDQPVFAEVDLRWVPIRDASRYADVLARIVPPVVGVNRLFGGLLLSGPGSEVERVVSLIHTLERGTSRSWHLYKVRSIQPAECVSLISGGGSQTSSAAPPLPPGLGAGSPGGMEIGGVELPAVPAGVLTGEGFSTFTENGLEAKAVAGGCLMRGTQEQLSEALEVLALVDVEPYRVEIEAQLYEVNVSGASSLGIRAAFNNGKVAVRSSDVPDPASIADVAVPGFFGGILTKNVAIAIDALVEAGDARVLSSPTLLVDMNEKAVLQVGDQVPIVTQAAAGFSTERIVQNVQYRDVGTILTVKPTPRDGDRIRLEVVQEVSDARRNTTSGIDSPVISQRSVQTVLTARDGQTIFLGGLMRQAETRTESGVPFLKDVPVVGAAFRQNTTDGGTTELVLLLTPHVRSDASLAQRVRQLVDQVGGASAWR